MTTPDFDNTLTAVQDAIDSLRKSEAYAELGPELFEAADLILSGAMASLDALRRAAQVK